MLARVTSKPTLHIHHEPEFHTLQIIVPFDISESRGKTCIPSVSSWWLFFREPKEKKSEDASGKRKHKYSDNQAGPS